MLSCKARERRTNKVNSSERNTADGRFSPRPAGVAPTHQYGVAALAKGDAIRCGLRLVLMRLGGSELDIWRMT